MKNTWKIILSVVGGLVLAAAAVVTVIHFWEDIKARLPMGKKECDCDCDCEPELEEDFEEIVVEA